MLFTRKKVRREVKLKLYNQELEIVKHFKLLGIWFDEKLNWAVHIKNIAEVVEV